MERLDFLRRSFLYGRLEPPAERAFCLLSILLERFDIFFLARSAQKSVQCTYTTSDETGEYTESHAHPKICY